ncbi:MAG: dihydrolipoyl dehydrogenase [Alphaproteobacteria bacterium]|nr:dihydrolipoyl dehydrogenase [Alphaproteobacteria bacterium]MDD9920111.1 dihydrolipoyl dehydrogenase [Alphaproteobacteria bacterium]
MTQNFDVVVIGTGPGGYVAAVRAAQLGFKVAVVEKSHLGGICLNWGCIPTKALLKASELKESMEHAVEFGLKVKGVEVDFNAIIERSRGVAGKLSEGIGYLMKKNKITVLEGKGVLTSPSKLAIMDGDSQQEEVTFKYAILATGARARTIPGVLEADEKNIWTYKTAMTPIEMPKSLLVVGAGAIGVEFASFYHALGVDVTLVEAQDRIVPVEDVDVSKELKRLLEKRGMTVLTKAKVENLKSEKDNVSVTLNGEVKAFDKAILAVGITGNVEGLGLEKLNIRAEKGQIKHNDFYQTSVPNIYAIGDVAGAPWLAHVASHEGVIAAEHIGAQIGKCVEPHPMDYTNIPGCTYCTPQVASTGLTEAAAKEQGHKVKVGIFNYQANGKALAIGEPDGFVKTVFDVETGALLGAHIIGAEATEMITTFVLGKHVEAVEEDFFHACLPHPTLSEMIGESALAALGRPLNS